MQNRKFYRNFRRQLLSLFTVLFILSTSTYTFTFNEPVFELSQKDKVEVFLKVWKLIDGRYFDPKMNGMDWASQKTKYRPLIEGTKTDGAFYDVIKKMVSEMNDAHTRFFNPREAVEKRTMKDTTVGLMLSKVEGKVVVEKISPDEKDELATVKEGMLVRTIDDKPIAEKLVESRNTLSGSSSNRALDILTYRQLLSGEPETAVKIGLTDFDGNDFDVVLTRKVEDKTSEAIATKLDSGIGYINVTSFKEPIADKFKKALLEIKDTPALIIDLRYNGGGSLSEVLEMAGYLINEKRPFGKFIRRKGKTNQSLKEFSAGKKGEQIYSKPIYILTSNYSASGSELFSSSLQEFGRAKVIGSQTCGCLLGVSRKYEIKGGGELHISDYGFLSSKGKVYEKIGITPDKIIELKIADLQSGFDKVREEAEKSIKSNL